MLFCRPGSACIFAGIGSVFTIANSSHKRFQTARDEWEKVKENAFVQRDEYEFGTGPLLFGVFPLIQKKRKRTYGKNLKIRHFHYQHFINCKNEKHG